MPVAYLRPVTGEGARATVGAGSPASARVAPPNGRSRRPGTSASQVVKSRERGRGRLAKRDHRVITDSGLVRPSSRRRAATYRAMAYRQLLGTYTNPLLARMELASKAGITFGGNRKLDKALGRVPPGEIEPEHYEHRYKRNGIARAIVEKLVKSALRRGADIIEDDGNEDRSDRTSWELEVDNLLTRLHAWEALKEAFIQSRKGTYSIIVIGTVDGDGMDRELVSIPGGIDGVTKLWPYPDSSINRHSKIDLIADESSPLYGYPRLYKIKLGTGLTRTVHHSRVIHIADSLLPWADPFLERVWDDLDDFDKIKGGGAEGTFQNVNGKGIWSIDDDVPFESDEVGSSASGDGDIDYDASPATYEDGMAAWRHDAINDLFLQGIKRLDNQIAIPDYANNARVAMRCIAAGAGYAERVLFGTEEGKLAGEQDSAAYADDVKGYREGFCTRHVRALIDWFIRYRVIKDRPYRLHWHSAEKLSPLDKSTITLNAAKTNQAQVEADGRIIYEPDEIRRDTLGYAPLEQERSKIDPSGANVSLNIRLNTLDDDAPIEVVRLDNVINEHESRLVGRIDNAIRSSRSEVDDNGNNIDEIVDELGNSFSDGLDEFLLGVLVVSAELELESVQENDSFLRTAVEVDKLSPRALIDIAFDKANPRAVDWAGEFASDTVRDLTDDARKGLNTVVSTAAELGYTTRQTAAMISDNIGLASNEVGYVANLARNLANADVGDIVRYGDSKVIVDGTQLQADRHINRYVTHLKEIRKKRLARSLLARTANEGLHELHRQAQEQGLLPDNVRRVYIKNTQRHDDRDGEVVRIGESFEVEPGADANCGCASGLVTV